MMTDSKWIHLGDGESVTCTIAVAEPKTEVNHWVKGQAKACIGAGCPFCKVNMNANTRHLIDVNVDGERKVLTLPDGTYQVLRQEVLEGKPMLGKTITVEAHGPKSSRRYSVALKQPIVTDIAMGENRTVKDLKSIILTLREIAEELESIHFTTDNPT